MLFSCPPRKLSDKALTVEPIGLHPLSWSSGIIDGAADQARIPLSRKPIIQPVPRGSSLIDKGHLLIRKVLRTWFSRSSTLYGMLKDRMNPWCPLKVCRDALLSTSSPANTIILPGDKRLVSHLSASFAQCLLFQALYQSTRIENRHPSYKSQDERK